MPTVEVNDQEVTLRLTYAERLAALSGNVRVPLAQVVSATVSQSPWTDARWSGINIGYILGTGLPYLLTFGHTVSLSGVDFVWLTRNLDGSTHPALVIVTRPPHRIRNIVVTAPDALALAGRINLAAATAAFAARQAQAGAEPAPASVQPAPAEAQPAPACAEPAAGSIAPAPEEAQPAPACDAAASSSDVAPAGVSADEDAALQPAD